MTQRHHRCGGCGRNLPSDHARPYFCSPVCRDESRERKRPHAKKSYDADPDKHRARSRRRRQQHPDKVAASARRWRQDNQDAVRAQRKRWAAANKDKRLAGWRRWVAANPEKNRAKVRAWAQAHPDRDSALHRAKRARARGAPGRHTGAEWRACVERYGRCCFYCGGGEKLTADHVIAIARGGSNSIQNIVPACRRCNSSKKASDARDWIARMQREGMGLTIHALALLATSV